MPREKLTAEEHYQKAENKQTPPVEAREHYLSAAQAGHAQAQYQLGKYYYYGWKEGGFASNMDAADNWYKKAADNGHVFAQHKLAERYEAKAGHDVDNLDRATKYYELAARQGYVPSLDRQRDRFEDAGKHDRAFFTRCKQSLVDSKINLALEKDEKPFILYLVKHKESLLAKAKGNTDQAVVLALNSVNVKEVKNIKNVTTRIKSALTKLGALVNGDKKYFSTLDQQAKQLMAPTLSSTAALSKHAHMQLSVPSPTPQKQPEAVKKSEAVVSLAAVNIAVSRKKLGNN